MPVLTQIITAHCPASLATQVLFDWSQDTHWRPSVRRMTVHPTGPAVAGQRILEELGLAGLTFVTPTRIDAVHPLRVRWSGDTDRLTIRGWREVEPGSAGTCRLKEVVDVRLKGVLRALTPLLGPLYRREMRVELTRLAEHLESVAVVPG